MREARMVVVVSVLAGLLLLAALPASASAGLAGFQYPREIAVQENSGETLHDYQVLVELSGSDFPGGAQPDGGDIRFTDADGVNLSYWIEEFDAGSKRAAIGVKVPEIPANGEAEIMIWRGNPSASSASDGDDSEDHTLTLPITVRAEAKAEPEQMVDTSGSKKKGSSTPGFVTVVAVIGLLAAYARKRS
ncbi:MAG: DUF2341 domain-containing protein [Methanosarcinales archaeon]|nr:DUF2341 domain-containing protein [Methanosarcinales archaeon]